MLGLFLYLRVRLKEKYIEMGHCSKPHGIKGQFQFHLFNPENSSLKKGVVLKLVPSQDTSSIAKIGEFFTLDAIQFGNKIIASLKEVDNRNRVEEMIPFTFYINRKDLDELSEDEVYLNDLIGLDVYNLENLKVGTVSSFYENGAQSVLVVEELVGGFIELPFVDAFFPEINIEENKIIMNNPGIF